MKQTLEQLGTRAEPGPTLPSLTACLVCWRGAHQRLSRVRPPIRVRLLLIVPRQVRPQPRLELCERPEVATLQELPRQHAEEQPHLVQPRAVQRQVVERMLVLGVAQERTPLLLRRQRAWPVR